MAMSLITTTSLPFLDAPNRRRERDRVHLAVLKLANGDAAEADRQLSLGC
jgi:hypothetical protein